MVGSVGRSPEKGSATRGITAGSSPNLKKKAALMVIFDGARVGEYLGSTGSALHKPIRPARHYRDGSTESIGAAAMASVARAIYGLTV